MSDETLFTSAVRINPNNGKIHNNLGHVYEHQEKLAEAEELFLLASQLQPDDVGAFINLGRVRKAQQKYKQAEQVFISVASKVSPTIMYWSKGIQWSHQTDAGHWEREKLSYST